MRAFFRIALVILVLYVSTSNSSIYTEVAGTLSDYLKTSLKNIKASFQETNNPEARFEVKRNGKPNRLSNQININSLPNIKISRNQPIITAHHEHNSLPKTIIRLFKTGGDAQDSEKRMFRTDREFRGLDKHYPRDGKLEHFPKIIMSPKFSKYSNNYKAKDEPYRLDAVLNSIRRTQNIARRAGDDTSSDTESSSLELKDWKDEWKELWIKKKIEAINQSFPLGDVVNMVAARPWGVLCGDPGQHDMPWGTCTMAMECEPEYRIYRGDFQCGRTKFVCCSIQLTNYDMYQGFDVSFADSGLSTDSDEQRNRGKGSSEKRRRKKERERKRRRKARQKRKKKIKKNIKKIIREIRKILNKQYRNGTTQRKRKTKQLKKFIKDLKNKYRQDRKSVKNIHEIELVKIDSNLINKLKEIKEVNENFVTNSTFREIILNGTINRQGARMLVEAYPELLPYFTDRTRRSGDRKQGPMDYDVEYGMLYY